MGLLSAAGVMSEQALFGNETPAQYRAIMLKAPLRPFGPVRGQMARAIAAKRNAIAEFDRVLAQDVAQYGPKFGWEKYKQDFTAAIEKGRQAGTAQQNIAILEVASVGVAAYLAPSADAVTASGNELTGQTINLANTGAPSIGEFSGQTVDLANSGGIISGGALQAAPSLTDMALSGSATLGENAAKSALVNMALSKIAGGSGSVENTAPVSAPVLPVQKSSNMLPLFGAALLALYEFI